MAPDTGPPHATPDEPRRAAGLIPEGVTARAAAHAPRERSPVARSPSIRHRPPAASRDRQPANPAVPATTLLPPFTPAPPSEAPPVFLDTD